MYLNQSSCLIVPISGLSLSGSVTSFLENGCFIFCSLFVSYLVECQTQYGRTVRSEVNRIYACKWTLQAFTLLSKAIQELVGFCCCNCYFHCAKSFQFFYWWNGINSFLEQRLRAVGFSQSSYSVLSSQCSLHACATEEVSVHTLICPTILDCSSLLLHSTLIRKRWSMEQGFLCSPCTACMCKPWCGLSQDFSPSFLWHHGSHPLLHIYGDLGCKRIFCPFSIHSRPILCSGTGSQA